MPFGGERRTESRQGESGGGGEKKPSMCLCVRGEYRAVALLQAPHFCQQWHLYLLNALLMPRHVCCCKLLLRPILDDEEKGSAVAARAPWFRPGSFLMGKRKRKISGTSLSLVCSHSSSHFVVVVVVVALLFVVFFNIISFMFPLLIFSFPPCILCIPPPLALHACRHSVYLSFGCYGW